MIFKIHRGIDDVVSGSGLGGSSLGAGSVEPTGRDLAFENLIHKSLQRTDSLSGDTLPLA